MLAQSLLRIAAFALAAGGADTSPLLPEMQTIVVAYRKMIVLLESAPAADPVLRSRTSIVGSIVFQENHRRVTRLAEVLAADVRSTAAAGWPAAPPQASIFLDVLESAPEWRDADRLALRDVRAAACAAASRAPSRAPAAKAFRARCDAAARTLSATEALYGAELTDLFVRPPAPPPASLRSAWDRYVVFVSSLYDRNAILSEQASAFDAIADTRVARGLPESALEISGSRLPLHTVLLTFDDGPHARFTDRILEELALHRTHAVFFEVGERIGRVEADESLRESSGAAITSRVVAAGMTIGNHSFTHPLLPRLSDEAIAGEIEKTSQLIAEITGKPPFLFRPPYGAANERVLAAVEAGAMRSVLWTVDSKDWADPIAASVAERVIREVRAQGCGIVLFHDIHGQTTQALPIVLDVLQAMGFRFLAWSAGPGGPDLDPR